MIAVRAEQCDESEFSLLKLSRIHLVVPNPALVNLRRWSSDDKEGNPNLHIITLDWSAEIKNNSINCNVVLSRVKMSENVCLTHLRKLFAVCNVTEASAGWSPKQNFFRSLLHICQTCNSLKIANLQCLFFGSFDRNRKLIAFKIREKRVLGIFNFSGHRRRRHSPLAFVCNWRTIRTATACDDSSLLTLNIFGNICVKISIKTVSLPRWDVIKH